MYEHVATLAGVMFWAVFTPWFIYACYALYSTFREPADPSSDQD